MAVEGAVEGADAVVDAVDVVVAGDKYNFTHEPLTPDSWSVVRGL